MPARWRLCRGLPGRMHRPGIPESEWPWYFIDPDTCIDCGACVPECPFEAIFPEDDVPTSLTLKPGQQYAPWTPRKS